MAKRTLFSYNSSIILIVLLTSILFIGVQSINAGTPTNTVIQPEQEQQVDKSGLVKILNYNTEQQGENETWTEVIKRENPDIFIQVESGFKENLKPWEAELNSFFPNEKPYKVYGFDGTSGTDGQAYYSRFQVVERNVVETVILDDGTEHDMNHAIMHAVFDIHGVKVHFLANHLSCCDAFDKRMVEQEGVINYMDSLGDVPILYGGDFNSDSPQDTGDIAPLQGNLGTEPIGMMLDPSHEHGPKIHNFTDTYRAMNPDKRGYTLNNVGDYQSIDHFRGRIDYIFVNDHLTEYMINSSVVTEYSAAQYASDHKPMYTWFNFKADQVDLRPPLNPQNLRIENVTESSTTLSWDANTEEDLFKYSVYRNGSLLTDIPSDTTTFTDNVEYDPSATYIYEITATDLSGNEGRMSLPVFADPDYGELFAPYGISLNVYSKGGATGVNWTITGVNSQPLTFIKVFKAVDPNATYTIDAKLAGTARSRTIDIPPSLLTTYVKITVGNAVGESDLTMSAYTDGPKSLDNDPKPDRSNSIQYGPILEKVDKGPEPVTIITPSTDDSSSPLPVPYIPLILAIVTIPLLSKRYKTT